MNAIRTDPTIISRPYPMVAGMLEARTGIRITPVRCRQLELAALKKLRRALAGWGGAV